MIYILEGLDKSGKSNFAGRFKTATVLHADKNTNCKIQLQKAINLLIEEGFLSAESSSMIKKVHFYVDEKRIKSTAFQNKQNLREIYIFNQ